MRLSKPLLDNHRRQRSPDRYCTEGETHHVPLLQRLMPRAEQTTLERLSWFTCARRDELLTANSRRNDSSTAPDDVAFFRSMLLELGFVTGGSDFHGSGTRRNADSAKTAQDDEKDVGPEITRFEDVQNTKSPEKVDSALMAPLQTLTKQEWKKVGSVQLPRDSDLEAYPSDTPKNTKASHINPEPVADTRESIPACTRCKVVGSLGANARPSAYID